MKKIYFILQFVLVTTLAFSQAPEVSFLSTITGLTAPVDIVNAKDNSNRLFIVQQNGDIKIYSNGALLATPFLSMAGLITYDVGGERGLLSIAFHPQYATNGYFFVFYNNPAGNTELAQYHVSSNANMADATSRKILLTITKPYTNHNGCKLNFGTDGNLYLGTGDGGSGGDPQNNAQNLNSLLGKMLRINVDNFTTAPYYTIPPSNPLVGMSNVRTEIFSWGLRNPWRWSFDKQTGDMWIGDVGQDAWEEINVVPAASTSGLNYGWRCYEGTHIYNTSQCGTTPANGKTLPIFEYAHNTTGGFAVTGGYVYRGTEYPTFQGYYFCADYVYRNGWLIKPSGSGGYSVTQQTNFPANVSTFGEAENGSLYLASLGGTIYKIVPSAVLAVTLTRFEAHIQNNTDFVNWTASTDNSFDHFEIEQSGNGTRFTSIGSVLPATSNTVAYNFSTPSPNTDRYYRLKMVYNSGTVQYSSIIHLSPPSANLTAIVIAKNQLQLYTPVALQQVAVINSVGQQLQQFNNISIGSHLLSLNTSYSGIYFLRYILPDGTVQTGRIFIN